MREGDSTPHSFASKPDAQTKASSYTRGGMNDLGQVKLFGSCLVA